MRFAAVGLLLWSLDWAVLKTTLGWGMDPYAGRVLSLALSMVVGFQANRRFTFRATGTPTTTEARRYALAAASGMAANYAMFAALTAAGANHGLGIAAGMGAAAVVTFVRFRGIFAA